MSRVPDGLSYTKDHEWLRLEGNRARIGITDHAQGELTDVVFVELPRTGREVAAGEEIGVVESVKAASEVYAPVSGKVVEVNRALEDNPALINTAPYGEGWILVLETSRPEEVRGLLDPDAYRRHIGE